MRTQFPADLPDSTQSQIELMSRGGDGPSTPRLIHGRKAQSGCSGVVHPGRRQALLRPAQLAALFYMPENELEHKALFVTEEIDPSRADDPLKSIQSDGRIVVACTVKDKSTGQIVTRSKSIKGPVACSSPAPAVRWATKFSIVY
jgi:hypothetical protein